MPTSKYSKLVLESGKKSVAEIMRSGSTREIVIEVEKVQTIRKRAKTTLEHCDGCGDVSDMVSHAEAALLFETPAAELFQFITRNNCHYRLGSNGNINLCMTSLIEKMRENTQVHRLTAVT